MQWLAAVLNCCCRCCWVCCQGSPLKMLAGTIPDGKEVDYRKILGMGKA
jgi:hypothetical protein